MATLTFKSFNNNEANRIFSLNAGLSVQLSGFCHNIRSRKTQHFIVLRKGTETIQLICFKSQSPDTFNKILGLSTEATIFVQGKLVAANVKSCTVTNHEVSISDIQIINSSKVIPFSLDDAQETFAESFSKDSTEEDELHTTDISARSTVSRQIRLDNRWLDLRIPVNQHIFKLKSLMEASIRQVLIDEDFTEIHTPKLISAVSEGGSNVFSVDYFGKKAYLAQSPQLYKQMMINAGFQRVFEVGPVFRAENANTYRHICEFTGLDFEFEINPDESHIHIIRLIWSILFRAFRDFEAKYTDRINYVLGITKTEKLIFPENPVIIDFVEGCRILRDNGIDQSLDSDIGSVNEKILGDLIRKIHNTDMYVLINYPMNARPFYTMPMSDSETDSTEPKYSKSFDIMMRCNEISSGAQRIHNPEQLIKAILNKGIKLDGTSGLEDYVKSFETGSMPHGGCGIGLERLCMLYFGLPNVRNTSLFPRDPKRITP
jgi:aspartyl-tRNA synthetase